MPEENVIISETTLRTIISDYIYRRPQYEKQMRWESEYSKTRIIVTLEETPFSQESLGYILQRD